VNVELHTSTSAYLPASLAWRRFDDTAQVAWCRGGPTRVPAATELLWHAITHAPLPDPHAFRLRFFQDAVVGWTAAGVDWSEIATRLGSAELPDAALARRWLGTATRLSGVSSTDDRLGPLPALDLSRALSWRLTIFRLLGARRTALSIWGPHPISRGRRLFIDAGTRSEVGLAPTLPGDATRLARVGRCVAAGVARACHRTWRVFKSV